MHFAATREPHTAEPAKLAERVSSWSLRKAHMFTDHHVRLAADRLADRRMLPA